MSAKTGRLIVISGPSGVGKGTVIKRLMQSCDIPLELSVSATTRPPRPTEQDHKDYHFFTKDEFERRRQADEFLECCEVFGCGHWYGTLKSEVQASVQNGKWVILEIDVEGASKIVEAHPEAVTIFVGLKDLQEIERRLRARGTDDEQSITTRIKVAKNELQQSSNYQHFVTNDEVDRAAGEICDILTKLA